MDHCYTRALGELSLGRPFMMVNYKGTYIRVACTSGVMTFCRHRGSNPLPFNDDGSHVPIVELATGELTWMSKEKPCMLYPGEQR